MTLFDSPPPPEGRLYLNLPQPIFTADVEAGPIDELRRFFILGDPSDADMGVLLHRLADAEAERDALLATRTGHRTDDPDTSIGGADGKGASTTFRRGTQKHRLLAAYGRARNAIPDGITDHQAADMAGLTANRSTCWWKRSSELREVGYIETTGATRVDSDSGKDRECCRITDAGRRYLDRLGPVE